MAITNPEEYTNYIYGEIRVGKKNETQTAEGAAQEPTRGTEGHAYPKEES
jgi:hypothetical protein